MPETLNGDALLAKIKPQLKEVRTEICLRPDLIDEWVRLNDELANAQARGVSGRLNDNVSPEAKKIAKKIQAVEAEIQEHALPIVFRALPVDEYQALVAEFPPRKDNQFDAIRGYNLDAVADALVRKSLIEPEFSDEGWANLRAALSRSEWDEMRNSAAEANGGAAAPPKSELASRVLGRSNSGSK